MILHVSIYFFVSLTAVKSLGRCPYGSYILTRGLSPEDEIYARDEHNRYRSMLTDGLVPGQPRAKYMNKMYYDKILAEKCEPVSDQCMMNHLPVTDERWECAGQNIYIAWHSVCRTDQNWTAALQSWFDENTFFQYPNISLTGEDIGHYTQVVWANSEAVGCDFILYIDPNKPCTPFCSLYTCNYGPCGNFIGEAPYKLFDDSWESSNSCESNEDETSSDESSETSYESCESSHESSETSQESHKTSHESNYHHSSSSHVNGNDQGPKKSVPGVPGVLH